MNSANDTVAAIATPIGEASVGVIRISGAQAVAILEKLFKPFHPLKEPTTASPTAAVGKLTVRSGDADAALDQVVVTRFKAPHSYTGEDVIEITGHGNPRLLDRLLCAIIQQGARLARPGEFTERAFLNGKLDLTQAEAVADLIRAKTDHAQRAAWGQLEGRLAAEVRRLRDHVLPLLAHVEVALDHSDEGHDFLSREALADQCGHVENAMEGLLQSARVGQVLREGFRVALVGRPNVGKSSLLNRLLREERAIVTPVPGTTRDTLEETVQWDGIPVILTDTAGLRAETQDVVEKLGMERSRDAIEKADFVLVILDGSIPLTAEDRTILTMVEKKPHLLLRNKSDLPLTPSPLPAGEGDIINVSAKTGQGIEDLIKAVRERALEGSANAADARWMLNARHKAALENARGAIHRAAQGAEGGQHEEVIALELKAALSYLGEIIGETSTEELLGQIFANFCVGK